MNVLVCMKQILDPDIPAREFRIDPGAREAVRGSADLVANIFCENALETALQLRAAAGGQVAVLTYGTDDAEDVLRKALAMKADAAALVEKEDASHPDALAVAKVLAAAARRLADETWGAPADLVMVGRESGDWGVGQTGGLLAEELGLPFVALVDHVESREGGVRLRRQTDSGFEILEVDGPAVVSITNSDSNLPRIPKTRDVMRSYKKPLERWPLADLGLDGEDVRGGTSYYELVELEIPEQTISCEIVEDVDTFAERVASIMNGA